jgi:hypothetical protein
VWDTQWEESMSKASFIKFFREKVDSSFHEDPRFDAKWKV